MPSIDLVAERAAERRAYLKSLRKGSYITAGLAMAKVSMRCDGRMVDVTPEGSAAKIEAERKAKDRADWLDLTWRVGC